MKKIILNVEKFILSLIISVFTFFFLIIGFNDAFFSYSDGKGITITGTIALLERYTLVENIKMFLIIFLCVSVIIYLVTKVPKNIWVYLYKYRYILAIVVLCLCVVLELSGSSIAYLAQFFPSVENTDTIFRMYNPYRGDEFAVNTMLAFAQENNPYQYYPYFSETVRGTTTDMFIVYGQPVFHYGVIFRPFQIGYLFLGAAKGLSFFWCGRFIVLFCVSYEFGRLLFEDKRKIALSYALLITLSPAVQWWFAINSFVELLIFGQLCVIVLDKYLLETNYKKKIIYGIIFFWSGGCYVLGFYPAWQVSLGYVFLFLFIWVFWKNQNKKVLNWKKDGLIICIIAIIWLILIGNLIYKSWDTISAVMNTVYPGKRISTDKISIRYLCSYVYDIFLTLTDGGMLINWQFIDFFPLGIIAAIFVIFYEKKKDPGLILLLILQTIIFAIYTLPVPEIILKMTLFSQVTGPRIVMAIGLINILLLLRAAVLITTKIKPYILIGGSAIYALLIVGIAKKELAMYPFSKTMLIIAFVVFMGCGIIFALHKNKKIMNYGLVFLSMILLVAGGLVNPIQKGVSFLTDHEVIREIQSIAQEDSGKWIVEGSGYPTINFPLMAGAPIINCTNVYPNLEQWRIFDENGENDEVYNRYAHIQVNLNTSSETQFNLLYPDSFQVVLNVEDLEDLEVKYIFSPNELEAMSNEKVTITKRFSYDGWSIYQVDY